MNGVVNFYKESGPSSFQAMDAAREILNARKCGHLGTLDPMAEGVLPICLGYATRFADYLSASDKEYIAEFKLGISTDSMDVTGNVLGGNEGIRPDAASVGDACALLTGEPTLTVPAFSAKKINGVRAYKLAREGAIEDAGSKPMKIYRCELLSYSYPLGIIRIRCAKGAYVRSVVNRMGEILGCGAVMSGLVRTANGIFTANGSFRLSDLRRLSESGRLSEAVISVDKLLDWGKALVKDEAVAAVKNGMSPERSDYLKLPLEREGDLFFIGNKEGRLLAVSERREHSSQPLKIKMVLA